MAAVHPIRQNASILKPDADPRWPWAVVGVAPPIGPRTISTFDAMSIYATLWVLRFPSDGDFHSSCDWVEVLAQSVPSHIGTPTPGHGYEDGDPYASFLPPPIPVNEDGEAPFPRAVVFVTGALPKGTERSGQEYPSPLLVLSGKEYAEIAFDELHSRICSRLRGNRAPIVAELFRPSQPPKTIRGRD